MMSTWLSNLFSHSNSAVSSQGAIGAQGSVSSSPPPNPVTGATWVNSTTGNISVHNGSQWITVGAGGGGGTGYSAGTYTISPVWSNISSATTTITSPLVVTTADGKKYDITKMLDAIMEQMCIIMPDKAKMEKYPALHEAYNEYRRLLIPEAAREAYENYKTIEALLTNEESQENE